MGMTAGELVARMSRGELLERAELERIRFEEQKAAQERARRRR